MRRAESGRRRRSAGLRARAACVNVTHMRRSSVREVQHNLPKILRAIDAGEVVEITRRNRVVARLVPAATRPSAGLPDFVARARAIWGGRSGKRPASAVVIEGRSEPR